MKYKYYLGPSGSGKTKKIMSDITERALAEENKTFLLIVPDQYTMQAQKDMVEMNPNHGIMNIDVLSFGRLYHKVIEEVGHGNEVTLDDTGKNLLLRRVSLKIADELETIGSSLDKPGFIHEVKSVISEFIQYGYEPESLDKLIEEADRGHKKALKKKLVDLKKVYFAFQEYKKDKYITTEETMGLLARKLAMTEGLDNAVIAFDGFTGFTPIQKQVIVALTHKASELWFSVVLDSNDNHGQASVGELFGLSKRYMASVDRIMQQEKAVKLGDCILPEGNNNPRFKNDELSFVERNIFRNNNAVYNKEDDIQNITLFKADNPREELRHVCVEINKLIRTGKYAYRDMAVVTGGLDIYAPFVNDLFGIYEIPVFIDQGRKLVLNPMIEYVKAGLAVIRKNFSYESVMHLLRSGVSGISWDKIDEFENYLLALGIKGYKAYSQDFARFPKYLRSYDGKKICITDEAVAKLGEINDTRRQFMEIMAPLVSTVSGKNRISAREITESLYNFIADNGLYERIEQYVSKFEETGDLQRKKEYEQVYRELMKLLEQIVALVGDEQFELDEYIKILEAGISEIKIGTVPGQTDYVLVGDIERSRLKEIKILFLVGANDGNIPKNSGNGGIISDLDREFLAGNEASEGIELAPTAREKIFSQKLYLYMNMTKPSEKLYLSYADTDALGKALKPSYLIDVINKLIPGIKLCHISGTDYLTEISGKKDEDSILADLIRRFAAGSINESDEKLFYALYDWGKEDDNKLRQMRDAAFYHYETKPLAREVVNALYGKVIMNSISRLERYAGCAYSHFLQYGIALSTREEFDVSRMDIGNVYHEVLQRFAAYIKDHELDWAKLDDDEARKILDEIYDGVVNSYGESLFFKDAKSAYEIEKMKRVLLKAVDTVVFQVKKAAFRPKEFELEFKNAVDAKAFNIGLSDDEKIAIRGKIDRIDTYEDSQHIYVKIVDYKSSQRKLDLVQVYNGLSLQLVVYLDQAVKEVQKKSNKEVKPAAMYYYPVYLPTVESDEPLDIEEINASIRKSLIQAGVSVRDDELIEKLGGQFDKNSEVIKVDKTAKGDYTKNSELIDEADLNTVMQYANYKLGQISKSIIDGNIEARPCGEGACTYCPFRQVCGYDERVEGYKDNSYEKIDKDSVIESMKIQMNQMVQNDGDVSE